jgi:type IV pilus assembly protein PilW
MRAFSQSHRGFSIVEVLVAMAIALLGTIIIFQVFAVSEGIKRTTTSGGDAQQNGLLALFAIERSARTAGFGVNFLPVLGCSVAGHDEGPPVRDFTFNFVAAQIADGGGTAPDAITLTFGNSGSLLPPAQLQSNTVSGDTAFKIDNRYGFNLGEVILVANQGISTNCTMRQVTALPGAATDTVGNNSGTYTDAQGNIATARYNKPGGIGSPYNLWDKVSLTGGRLFDLGATPSVLTFSIVNSQLVMQSLLAASGSSPIADGIVQLQALYGKDTDGNGSVDTWDTITPASNTAWSQVLALRIALVSRSNLAEKPVPPSTVCNTTTAAPSWTGPAGTPVAFDLSTDPNWQCYRYRVFETTVPLRNNFWIQAS